MRSAITRVSKPALFTYLMLFSVVLLLVPVTWKGWLRGIVQPIGWIEWVFSSSARSTRDAAGAIGRANPSEADFERTLAEIGELQRQLAAQSVEMDDLRRMLDDISGIRDQLGTGGAKILFGAIIGGSPTPKRETVTIWPGSLHGVRVGDWVAAGLPEELRDESATGQQLLVRQWLIGRVSEVQPYRATVRLTTDAEFGPERVVAARRLADGRWQRSGREGLLRGNGNGRMKIASSPVDWHAEGYSLALATLPGQTPIAVCVGRITGSQRVPEAALYFDLNVEPIVDSRRIGSVYVLSFEP